MRQEIELYLGGRSVEFNEPPEILFSYIRTDYTDPTVLRNSYSKTLTIEGTPNNNQIFNSIYHLDQIVDMSTFNPAKRMDFQLFSNGDILEQGYAKLDKVNKNEKNITYDITLYGGLGEFLYNLSYDQTAEGSDTSRGGGEDRRLSSLVFYDETEPNKEFDFDITKETVAEAWDALESKTGATKWKYINFAPAYNGYPEDFDADKVLINTQNSKFSLNYNNNGTTGNSTGFPQTITQGSSTYRAYNNYALGELPKEMTEWEMRDLRSYLQRPVLSMKGFMEAISNPINNGGYDVDLDTNFFNDNNPYYADAWITLPMLKKDETVTGQSAKTQAANNVLSVSSQLGEDYDCRYYLSGLTPGAVYNGIDLTFSFKTTISGMPNEVLTTAVDYNAGGIFARDAAYFSSIFVQLVGEDEQGNALAASPIFNFTSPYGKQKGWKFIFGNEWEGAQSEYCKITDFSEYKPVLKTDVIDCQGGFKKISGNNYTWYNKAGNQSAFTISLTDKLEYARVYFRVTKVYKWRNYKSGNPDFNRFEERLFGAYSGSEETSRNVLCGYVDGGAGGYSITASTGVTRSEVVGSQTKYTVTSDVVRSGSHISKGDLLNFDGTPCDYLLSYCKLFNLFISKDIYENTIHIRTRDSFYNGGTIDLDKFIDRSKEIKVTPLAMDSRWYDFAYPEDEMCGAAEDYDFNYGVEYGKNKVQTAYEFDSAAIDLFNDNIFRNSVQVQESSKYYTLRTAGGKTIPTFLYGSVGYKLFRTPNDVSSDVTLIPPSGYTQTGYTSSNGKEDWLPKLQLHNDNEPIDGTNVLCFFTGFKSSPYVGSQQAIYYLTDDVAEMYVINGETPCWLWTITEKNGDQTIAKGMTKLPIFSRMIYDSGETNIEYTWDFGRVRDTYVPVKSYADKSTIYERWWADYIADLYDPNTRVAEVWVKMEGKVVGDWLRAMYWWDNTYWVLTEINDYNITSYDTTKCKFVRVNDITNYTSSITPPQPSVPRAYLVPDTYMISATGETISAYVKTTDGGAWHLEYPSYVTPSQVAGTGDTQITLTFDANSNNDGRDFYIYAFRTTGTGTHFWQNGAETVAQNLTINGNTRQYVIFGWAQPDSRSGYTIQLTNRGTTDVTITSDSEWLTFSAGSWNGESKQLTIYVTDYGTEFDPPSTARSGKITVSASTSAGGRWAEIWVDQIPYGYRFPANGGSRTIALSHQNYSISTSGGNWANINKSTTATTMTAPLNTGSVTLLEETVYFTVGDTVAGYRLSQENGGIKLTTNPVVLAGRPASGGSYNVSVTLSGASLWSVSASTVPDWITLNTTWGHDGVTVLTLTLDSNIGSDASWRSATIILSASNGTNSTQASITVYQDGEQVEDYFTADPTTLVYDYTGGTKYVTVDCNKKWTISNWSTIVSPTSFSGAPGVTILGLKASRNYTSSAKTGTVTLKNADDETITINITIKYEGQDNIITASPENVNIAAVGGTQYTYVTASGNSWSVISKPSWVILTQNSGTTGNTMLGITAGENQGSTRSGNVVLSDGTNTFTVVINQPGTGTTQSLTTTPTAITSNYLPGVYSLTINYTNRGGDDLNVTVADNWCSVSPVSWNGDSGSAVVSLTENTGESTRQTNITLTGVLNAGNVATVAVSQDWNKYLSVSPASISFSDTGGTATITIESSVDWTINIDNTGN